jgi:hypothetical protein
MNNRIVFDVVFYEQLHLVLRVNQSEEGLIEARNYK